MIDSSNVDDTTTELLDDHGALVPPDPIPNSEVKRCIADGSVGLPHVRVGHRQASNRKAPLMQRGFFYACPKISSVTTSLHGADVQRTVQCELLGTLHVIGLRSLYVLAGWKSLCGGK